MSLYFQSKSIENSRQTNQLFCSHLSIQSQNICHMIEKELFISQDTKVYLFKFSLMPFPFKMINLRRLGQVSLVCSFSQAIMHIHMVQITTTELKRRGRNI